MTDQVKYSQKLKGDKVLIIGGSSGIGYGVAEATLELGLTVIISSSSAQKVQDKVAELQQLYPSAKDRVSGHACNLGDEANLEKNVRELLEKVGVVDHIVHTAGDSLSMKPLAEIDMDFVKKAGLVRFFSVLMLAKHAPKYLTPGPKSSITLTSGSVAEKPLPDWTVVNAYATGLQGITRGMALDLKPIRVNLVQPGAVATELWKGLSDDFVESLGQKNPVGKTGEVVDVAESYLYCLKDRNVTGSIINTNGGHLLV